MLDSRSGLKAMLVSLTGFIAVVGAVLYTFAFIADWNRVVNFDYEPIAKASVVILMSTIAIAGCCTYITQS
jgi:hypothetical protein